MAKLSAFFGFTGRNIEVQPGYVYQRTCRGDWVEIAKVCAISKDPLGIPHVAYDLLIERNQRQLSAMPERRTMNLRQFQESFHELIRSEPPTLGPTLSGQLVESV